MAPCSVQRFSDQDMWVGDLKQAVRGTGNDPGTIYAPGMGALISDWGSGAEFSGSKDLGILQKLVSIRWTVLT